VKALGLWAGTIILDQTREELVMKWYGSSAKRLGKWLLRPVP